MFASGSSFSLLALYGTGNPIAILSSIVYGFSFSWICCKLCQVDQDPGFTSAIGLVSMRPASTAILNTLSPESVRSILLTIRLVNLQNLLKRQLILLLVHADFTSVLFVSVCFFKWEYLVLHLQCIPRIYLFLCPFFLQDQG